MKKILFILFLFLSGVLTYAQSSFDPRTLLNKKPDRLVNDYSNTLTPDQVQALEQKVDAFDQQSSTQIAVAVVPELNGIEISDFNVKLLRAWGVGSKKNNNGALLLIAIKEHQLDITTGYGLEGSLDDITAKHIIDEVIVPNFKGSDYYGGIDQGIDAMIKATKGEYTAPPGYGKSKLNPGKIFLLIVIVIILLSLFSGGGGGGTFISRGGFINPFLFGGFGGGGSGGGWSGGGGGGFGGFGGGSGGGGGASGSW